MLTDEEIKALPFDPRKMADPELELPDLTEAITGWRAWSVKYDLPRFGVDPKLFSATYKDYYWTPGKAARATCPHGRCEGDDLPGESCTCGFYSGKSAKHLLELGYHRYAAKGDTIRVVGKVACWGKVVEGSLGWRSEYAYPVLLYVPYEALHLAKPLEAAYGPNGECKVAPMNFNKRS